jgi:O-antigen/teichoic acid export membrane protein
MSLNIHFLIAIIFFIIIEIVGLWFIYNKMNIDLSKLSATFWVFQFSIISLLLVIVSAPYHALIIANEDMTIFAYVEIIGVLLKLIIVYALHLFSTDKLITYSLLLLLVTLIIRLLYMYLCKIKYKEISYRFFWDKLLFQEMFKFNGWTTLSAATTMARSQGINVLFNIFIGVTVNAAMGIANQVNAAINSFTQNFQLAFFPQITKSYAEGDIKYMIKLIFSGAKLSYMLLLILSLPIIVETNFILNIWLKNIPEYTSLLVILILIDTNIKSFVCTINTAMRATGKIKLYEIMTNIIIILSLLVCYILLKNTGSVLYTYLMLIMTSILSGIVVLIICVKHIKFSLTEYFHDVFFKMILISILSFAITYLIHYTMDYGLSRFLIICVSSCSSTIFFTYFWGLKDHEKRLMRNLSNQIMCKLKKIGKFKL